MKDRGIGAAVVVIVIVVASVAAAGGYFVLFGGGAGTGGGTDTDGGGTEEDGGGGEDDGGGTGTMNTNATVKLHDDETINLSGWVENYVNIPGIDVSVQGTVTVNNFSATDITVELHNEDSGQWVTIVEDKDISDLTVVNELTKEISSGTYDKVSVYLGTIDIDIEWTDIEITGSVDLSQYGVSETQEIDFSIPGGSFNESVTINQDFVINFPTEVSVTSGENQVFDVDTGVPFDLSGDYSIQSGVDFSMDKGDLDNSRMQAVGL